MLYALASTPLVPVRKTAAHESELVNQLLFGDSIEVLEQTNNNWCRIKSLHDEYEGWVSKLQIEFTGNTKPVPSNWIIDSPNMADTVYFEEGPMHIPTGSSLPLFDGKRGSIAANEYTYGAMYAREVKPNDINLDRWAFTVSQWEQAPYLWGGRTRMGVDCSGLTQVLFKMLGISLLRDASQQATQGEVIDFLQQARFGDLAFFDNEEGEIYHVGILLNNSDIIHASGKVRKDKIDNAGIVNKTTGERTHRLRIIKRYF